MLNNRRSAVEAVTPLFRSAEASNDIAAADAASYYAALLRARVDNRLSVTTGAEMIGKMFEAIRAQQLARDLKREAHLTTPDVIGVADVDRAVITFHSQCSNDDATKSDRGHLFFISKGL